MAQNAPVYGSSNGGTYKCCLLSLHMLVILMRIRALQILGGTFQIECTFDIGCTWDYANTSKL